ncbi:uncharacterized protein IL334_004201 [Kwoniella shivajii]|uniref:Uncharacterized protein n=1 Tax=Kwoniella shivajii TaxID=564305 RepID=A0ABZ1D1F6_9TREE|nr:hypothetical protein IL334_004201 [Kwoniella shivajii]
MSFRTSLLRAHALPRLPLSRPLSTFSSRPIALPTLAKSSYGVRNLTTTRPLQLESSRAVGDGGVEEAPHSGINVDRSIRMDT